MWGAKVVLYVIILKSPKSAINMLILTSATLLCTLEAAQAQIFPAAIFPWVLDPRSARHVS